MKEVKKALRKDIRAKADGRLKLDGNTAAVDQTLAAQRIEALPMFAAARTVALYHALPDEVSTAEMLRRWQGRKRLALPVILDHGEMAFREYTGESNLDTGVFGIDEPKRGAVVPPTEIDLMIVPGVAFDAAGRRLGRGGGFYDRYLSQPEAAHIYKVGLCRPGALVPEVPAEAHDVVMDEVVTATAR